MGVRAGRGLSEELKQGLCVGETSASGNQVFGQQNGASSDDLLTLPGAEQTEGTNELDAVLQLQNSMSQPAPRDNLLLGIGAVPTGPKGICLLNMPVVSSV